MSKEDKIQMNREGLEFLGSTWKSAHIHELVCYRALCLMSDTRLPQFDTVGDACNEMERLSDFQKGEKVCLQMGLNVPEDILRESGATFIHGAIH